MTRTPALFGHLRTMCLVACTVLLPFGINAQNGHTHGAVGTIGNIAPIPVGSDRGGVPPNALCSGALIQPLSLFASVSNSGDNTGGLVDNYFQLPVVWEGFVSTECLTVRVSYCGTTPRFEGALLALAVGCPLSNVARIPVSGVTMQLCADHNFTLTFPNLPAGTYYFPVLQGVGFTGPYTITFTGLPCTGSPPTNDDCAGATELVPGVDCIETTGNNAGTTVGTPASLGCNGGDPSDDVWYSFVATHADHTITVEPRTGFDAVIEVYSGACGSGTLVACRDVAFAGETEVATLTGLTVGETYYVRVYDWYAGASMTNNFTICVQRPPCLADAGTLAPASTPVCLVGGLATIAAILNGDAFVPAGFDTAFLLTQDPGFIIQNVGTTPSFDVNAAGPYTIHTLVFDPLTFDPGTIQVGVTTCFDVNALLEEGGGLICGSLDMIGALITVDLCIVCDAEAGTITADADTVCFVSGAATITATPNGDAVVPVGFELVHMLTQGAGLVIQEVGPLPSFDVTAVGNYTIHTLVYDPLTFDTGTIQIGVTTGFDVNALLVQGGGTICASLDVSGAPVNVRVCLDCEAVAGTLTALNPAICLVGGAATIADTPNGDAVVPVGFEVLYLLSEGGVIQASSPTPSFDVAAEGSYAVHTLVYDPLTLDIGSLVFGVTTMSELDLQLIQGGGTVCASLDLAGGATTVQVCVSCTAASGTLTADATSVCILGGVATVSATPNGNAIVPVGYETLYLLATGAVVQGTSTASSFEVNSTLDFTIHTLVYDPLTFDPGTIQSGVTTVLDLNALLIQGGGVICAGLDLAGASLSVEDCAPLNDQCANAITLAVNSEGGCPAGGTTGDNTYATSSGSQPSCDTNGLDFADVWYTFNSGSSTTVFITFDHGSMTDWGITVTDACDGNEVECVVQPADVIEIPTQPDTDYWVRVYTNTQFGAGGSFTICLTGLTEVCDGGIISSAIGGVNPVIVCQDAQPDVIDLITSSTSMENYVFILTDASDLIVTTLVGASIDFNLTPLGIYHVWGVSYNGTLVGTDPGGPVGGVSSTGSCIDISTGFLVVSVEVCNGVRERGGGVWSLFPNPGNGDLTVVHGTLEDKVLLEVFDVTGRAMYQEQWHVIQGQPHHVALAGRLAEGTYLVRFTSSDGRSEQRVVIQ
ncbi:MAG: T9SS type A sorting domain-containing protein [Flavobacteriales bacterium]